MQPSIPAANLLKSVLVPGHGTSVWYRHFCGKNANFRKDARLSAVPGALDESCALEPAQFVARVN